MKLFLLALVLLVSTIVLSCNGSDIRKENIRNATKSMVTQLNNENCKVPFDSVYVIRLGNQKDSLAFFKSNLFIGSSTITYE